MDARLEALAAEGAGRRLGRWSLLVVFVVLGCAASPVPSRTIDPTAPLAVTRTGLAQAEALADAGHVDEAADAARRAAEQARQDGVLAALEADDDARRQAQKRWRQAARVARRLAARTRDRDAELAAVLASPRPQRFRGRMRRRADQLLPEFEALEAAHADLARRGDDGVPWLRTPYSVTAAQARLERFEALPRRWRRDPERIDAALDDAVNARAPRRRLVAIARAMVRRDPWHVPAQLVLALDREITAGRLADDPSLWPDVVHGYGSGPLARLDARWRATSLPALRLAWIHVALASDLVGDAAAAMSELRAPGPDVALANAMAALLALHLGDGDRFARWRRDHGEPSMWLDQRVESFDMPSFAPRLRVLGAEARRRHVDDADEYAAQRVASDPGARRSERRIAERRLSETGRRLARACAPLGEKRDACLALHGGGIWGQDDERVLGGASRATLLGAVGSSAFDQPWAAAPAELDAGPLRDSAWYRSAAVDTALREGDGDRAARWIDGHGAALGVSSLVAVALADAALRDGEASAGAGAVPSLGAFGTHPSFGGKGSERGAELSRAFEAAAAGQHAEAATILAPLAAAIDGRAGAWLSALQALAALRADDGPQVQRALARVERLAPDAALGHYVRGHVELRADRPIRARHHFAAALRRDGDFADAFDGLLEATLRSPGVTESLLRQMVVAAPRSWRREHAPLVRVARRGRWTDPKAFAQVWLLLEREAPAEVLALAPIDPEAAERAVEVAWERLIAQDDPRAFDALAAGILAAIPHTRDPEVWDVNAASLHFVLGRPDAARAVLTRVRPLEPTSTVGLLLAGRGAMTAAVARTLWRAVWVEGEGEADPALDAWLGAADQPAELALACQILVDHGRDAEADDVCGRAQPHFPASAVLAVQRSVARARHDPEHWSELARPLFGGTAPPGFAARPTQPVDGFVELWFTHRALVLQELGRHDDAAKAWLEAIALDGEPEEDDDAQLALRGWTFRAREVSENDEATERSITLAIAAGELVVARAAALAASTSSEGADPAWRFAVGRAARLVAITESDLARRRIDRGALASARALLEGEGDLAAAQAFHDAHPTSALAAVLRVEACLREGRLEDCDAALAQLHGHRRDPLVAVLTARVAIERDDPAAARASVAAADTTGLGGALAQWAELPEGVRGRDPALDGLRDAARLEQRLRAGASRRGTTRVVAMAHGIEVVPPAAWGHEIIDRGVRVTTWNAAIELHALPRAARCTGVACAESVLDELRRAGATVLSTRQVTLPAGAATEIVAANRTRTLLRWVVPLGARIFELRAEVDHDHLALAGPALRATVDSFRALDGVLSAFDAESLRTAGAPLPEAVRARARAAAHAAPGSGCPVTAELAALDDATAGAVLLDLWLATPDAARRRRLVACAPASSARAARLGLVALLDETPSLHAFGRAVIDAQPAPALRDAALLLPQHDAALSDPQRMLARELPARGVLELALALPIDEARRFTRGLLDGDDPGRRAMGWAAVGLRDGLLDRAEIMTRIAAPTVDTLRAVRMLERAVDPAELARLRVVFDALSPRTHVERELAESLALRIGEAGSSQDHRRLAAAAARVQDDTAAADAVKASRSLLRDIAEAHARRRAGTRAGASNPRVGRLVDEWQRARDDGSIRWRSPDDLRTAGLAELLPGDDWVLARVGNPSLVGAAARGLLRRLQGARATETPIVARIVGAFLDTPAAQLLEPESGLDLTRPIECASRTVPSKGMVCVAHVVDRERVLAALGQRGFGDDAGVTAPLSLIEGVPVTPLALSVLPVILHALDRRDGADAPKRRVTAAERARTRLDAGPFALERYAIAQVQEDDLSVDAERYLFVGERMFVFTNHGLVAEVLAAPEGPSLADGAEFRRLTAGWVEKAASLTAIAGGTTSPTDAPTTAEITVVRDGLHVRIRGEMRGRPTPTRLAAVLPEGAASTIILGPGVWRPKDEARSLAVDRADRGRVPPVVALLQAHDVAFGWYPRPGDALWQRWVAVLDDTPATAKALQAQGIRIGGVSPTLHTARRGGAVVLASDPELLAQSLPRIGTASAAAPLLAGTCDGHVAGAALAGFGAFGGLGKEGTRAVAMLLGIVRRAEYDAVLDPGTGLVTLSGRLQLSAAAEETPEIVDAWLAARDDGNSTRLPRRVAARELAAPLSYVFEVDDGRWFADDVLSPSPRTRVTVRDAHHVQVDVRPAAEAPASALDAAQRREHIAATNSFPSRDPAITSLLGSIVDDAKSATDRATKINAFVHGRLRYAVTPQHLDGVEVLTAGEGDCSEYATLTVTLLRAASIPAVLVQGMVASGDRMVAHAWVSYHDGQRWREIDPTAGTMGVTSGHLELSVVDALSLHAMGRLLVTGVTGAAK